MKEDKQNIFTKLKNKNAEIKSKIDSKIGALIYKVCRITMIVLFWAVIPLTAVTLTTLSGLGTISIVVYQGIIWPMWIILIISFVLWTYFKDFRNEQE